MNRNYQAIPIIFIALSVVTNVRALPMGGGVVAGRASINNGVGTMAVTQLTPNVAINWQSFNIGPREVVQFVQPGSNSIALNRVLGSDPSSILGSLSANGKVFLVNPSGILFGKGSQVNVGGLVASTLNISDQDFMSGRYQFFGSSTGEILNQGAISTNASTGLVALLGAKVSNDGIITARLGTVVLAAGTAITLDVAGDGLLNVTVNQGAVNSLIRNGGLIQADGGQVLLTAQAAQSLLKSVVNNTGVIQAQTIENHSGTIKLLADMQSGSVNLNGTLAARGEANSGDGGFIETSGSRVVIASGATVDTLAPHGKTGKWLLDPLNYVISTTGDETPASVVASLATTDRLIVATNDITVGAPVTWTSAQSLTLSAGHDVLVNAPITSVPAGAGLVLTAGNDVNVSAAITATAAGSSIKLNAGRDVITTAALTASAATTSIMMVAGRDISATAAITATAAGTVIDMSAGRNLSVAVVTADGGGTISLRANNNVVANAAISASTGSVSLIADNDGTGPGVAGGTVTLIAAVTAPSTTIRFNPNGYANTSAEIAGYVAKVTGALDAKAWVFAVPDNKVYDGNNMATLALKGNPGAGGNVILSPGSATFDTKNVGVGKTVMFSGSIIGGTDVSKFALFAAAGTATADITTRALTLTSANKIYDGTTNALIAGDNRIAGDVLTLSNIIANFADKNVGNGKGVSVVGMSATGVDAANYNLVTALATTANITPAALTITASNNSKNYGQTPTLLAFSLTGLMSGETVGSVAETSPGTAGKASVAGGPYAITPGSAAGGSFIASNYTISYVNGALTVNPASLTITAANAMKFYGQSMTLTAFTVAGLMNGETIAALTETSPGSAASASVAGSPYPIMLGRASGGSFSPANYIIGYVNGELTVAPQIKSAPIGATFVASNVIENVVLPILVQPPIQIELLSIVPSVTAPGLPDGEAVEP